MAASAPGISSSSMSPAVITSLVPDENTGRRGNPDCQFGKPQPRSGPVCEPQGRWGAVWEPQGRWGAVWGPQGRWKSQPRWGELPDWGLRWKKKPKPSSPCAPATATLGVGLRVMKPP